MSDDQEHRQQKAEIANPIDDEGLLAGIRGRILGVVKADQQIGDESDTFPADKHQQEICRQHQRQHEKQKQIHVAEEAPVALLGCHVADGVEMNQQARRR